MAPAEKPITAKFTIPAAVAIALVTGGAGWVFGLATERGQTLERIKVVEDNVKDIRNDIGNRLHRVEAALNRIEGSLERKQP